MNKLDFDINQLYSTVLRESEGDSIQELDHNFYRTLSAFIGDLKKQEYDGVENKIKKALVDLTSELAFLLLQIRIDKTVKSNSLELTNLLDEEKFILNGEEEKRERFEMIYSATINGKSKFLESISDKHKTKKLVVRFLNEIDEFIGVDMEKYGPFKKEDIGNIPYENAHALITQNIATRIRWED